MAARRGGNIPVTSRFIFFLLIASLIVTQHITQDRAAQNGILWIYDAKALVMDVLMTSDGSKVIFGTNDGLVRALDRELGKVLWNFRAGMPYCISASESGDRVAVASSDGFYVLSGDGSPIISFGKGKVFYSSDVSRDGRYAAAGSKAGWLYFFSGRSDPDWEVYLGGEVVGLEISEDGRYLAAGSYNGSVYLFRIPDGREIWRFNAGGRVGVVAITHDGRFVAAGTLREAGAIYLISLSGTPVWKYRVKSSVYSIDITSDGLYIAAGLSDGTVYLFDLYGRLKWSNQAGGSVYQVDFADMGGVVATASLSDSALVYGLGGDLVWSLKAEDDVNSVWISEDGNLILIGTKDGKVICALIQSGEHIDLSRTEPPPSSPSITPELPPESPNKGELNASDILREHAPGWLIVATIGVVVVMPLLIYSFSRVKGISFWDAADKIKLLLGLLSSAISLIALLYVLLVERSVQVEISGLAGFITAVISLMMGREGKSQ